MIRGRRSTSENGDRVKRLADAGERTMQRGVDVYAARLTARFSLAVSALVLGVLVFPHQVGALAARGTAFFGGGDGAGAHGQADPTPTETSSSSTPAPVACSPAETPPVTSAIGTTPDPTPTSTPTSTPPAPEPTPCAPAEPLGPPALQILSPLTTTPAAKVSDRLDGVDEVFHLVAVVQNATPNMVVEASVATGASNYQPIGSLKRVTAASDTWELSWDIPQALNEGAAKLRMRLFDPTASNDILATDEVPIDIQHKDGAKSASGETESPAATTTNVAWPLNDGRLGWFRRADGAWATVVDGFGSAGSGALQISYSTTPIGEDPHFFSCEQTVQSLEMKNAQTKELRGVCALKPEASPSKVTAIAVAAGAGSAADVSRAHGYVLDPRLFQVTLDPPMARATKQARCMDVTALVTDENNRPVTGINLDVALQGPDDSMRFGAQGDAKAPDEAVEESASNCTGGDQGNQGVEVVPIDADIKRVESIDGPDLNGKWKFNIFSTEAGFSQMTAWVDDEVITDEAAPKTKDDDVREEGEAVGVARAQWLDGLFQLAFSKLNDTRPVGECTPHTVTVRSGEWVVPGINVDLHLRFPNDHVHFCDVGSSTNARGPDMNHKPTGLGDKHPANTYPACPGAGPTCIHVEGETDDSGRFTVGVTSRANGEPPELSAGIGQIIAWVDGEPGADDDLPDFSEATATSTINWVNGPEDVDLQLLTPATLNPTVATPSRTVLVRADAPYLVEDIEIGMGVKTGIPGVGESVTWTPLGYAKRIGDSDLYAYEWDLTQKPGEDLAPEPTPTPTPSASPTRPGPRPTPTPTPTNSPGPAPSVSPPPSPGPLPSPAPVDGVADGAYQLRARVVGSRANDQVTVTVNRGFNPPSDPSQADEWLKLQRPLVGTPLPIPNASIELEGIASPGAEGVYFYYGAGDVRDSISWGSMCGYEKLLGSGSTPQPFQGECELPDGVAGRGIDIIGALTFDCTVSGCDADPNPAPAAQGVPAQKPQGALESGDFVPMSTCLATPCVSLDPSNSYLETGGCQRMVATVVGADGKPVAGQNVDVQLSGPGDGVKLCSLEGGSAAYAPGSTNAGSFLRQEDPLGPDLVRAEGATDANGQFVFGVDSQSSGYASIFELISFGHTTVTLWADSIDDDVHTDGEAARSATVYWDLPDRCTIVGTAEDDILAGTIGNDKLCGLGGNDTVYSQEGIDIILGGDGDDILFGDEGRDTVYGQDGADQLRGGFGQDALFGGSGVDNCIPGKGGAKLILCEHHVVGG